MRATLKAGVQVVSAPQLFPTPPGLAARMVELAGIERGMRVLEPSAGTGRLLAAIREATGGSAVRTAIEISARMCDVLRVREEGADTRNCDFLECSADQLGGLFDRVVMNPPFGAGADIKHITHALTMLKPGGRLVALCANGPRQDTALRPLVDASGGDWEDLPADSFKAEGTGVSVALITLHA
jgi:predicted RNA methylase